MPGKKKKKKTEVVKDCVDPKYELWLSSHCLWNHLKLQIQRWVWLRHWLWQASSAQPQGGQQSLTNHHNTQNCLVSVLGCGPKRSFLKVSCSWNNDDLVGQSRTPRRDRRLVPPWVRRRRLRVGFRGSRVVSVTSGLVFPSHLRVVPGSFHLLQAEEKKLI